VIIPPPAPPDWTDAELAAMLEAGAVGWEEELAWGDGLDDRAAGPPEAIGAGFTHQDAARSTGGGFAAGGSFDVMEPCAVLAAFAGGAHDEGLVRLSDDELVGLLGAARRLQSWQAGIELSAVAELDRRRAAASRRPGWSRDDEHVAEELAAALVLTGRSADCLLGLARCLARLPAVRGALLAGRIDLARAVVFAQELAGLDDRLAQAVADQAISGAGAMTTGQLRNLLRRLILTADSAAARDRAERARKDARVESWGEGSGNSALAGRELPPADVIAADARLTAIASALKEAGAEGSMDQLRAAVFLALLTGRDPAGLVPRAAPGSTDYITGSVHLIMPMTTWLGRSDQPGEAAGYGPLEAGTCRDLAAHLIANRAARWCVTVTDTHGRAAAHACARAGPGGPDPADQVGWLRSLRFHALESGRCGHVRRSPAYRPTALLTHLVRVRQRTCCFPGCRRPAIQCDLDHTRPFDRGGATCECNLAPLCRRHHRAKQATGWKLAQPQPGLMTWHLPHGRSYQTAGEPYPF
jgi:hypothetical protein